MAFLSRVLEWFTDAANWQGTGGIPNRLVEHLWICGVAMAISLVAALPVGLVLGHLGRGGVIAVNVSNVGRALPSFALLIFTVQITGIGNTPAYVALVALAIPPMVTNAYVGMREVDAQVREAAIGMGMTGPQVMRRVEVPLALPLVMAGVRTSAVQVVATATLAAVVASGGLGRYIVDGLAQRDFVEVFAGALLVALLAMATELSLALLQRAASPGVRRRRRPRATVPPVAAAS